MAGGYAPMGAVFAKEEVVAPLAARGEDLMFYTFSGHPASCAVADKVLEIMERENLVERSARMGKLLMERLKPLEAHPNVAEVRGIGLFAGVELVRNKETLERFPAEAKFVSKVSAAGLGKGVFYYPGGSAAARDCIMIGPAFTINGEDIDVIAAVLPDAIDEALASLG